MLQPIALAVLLAAFEDEAAANNAAKHRFDDVAARALAVFEMVNNLEARVRENGLTLHPDIRGRKLRVEMALDDAEAAIKENRWKEVRKSTERASAHLERLEKALTGR
ncbi:MAG: hypothetical protein JST65_23205 [Acidobacteria bacterium]|nr:hypothetical protein [Acidobacteriota bacterium]